MEVRLEPPWLLVELDGPHQVASWAVVGGGLNTAERVAWLQIRDADLGPDTDPVALLSDRLLGKDLPGAVGMLTSSNLGRFQHSQAEVAGARAEAVTTVGLSNRLAVGDAPGRWAVGTINLLVVVHQPMSEAALLETLSIAVEARTAAVLALDLRSKRSQRAATGTGTDCVVVAAPCAGESRVVYAGKHTPIGAAVGRAVSDAVLAGGRAWQERAR